MRKVTWHNLKEFIDFEKPNHVYKLKKALYGLKQAPKSWYDRLKAFLIKHEYNMGMVDNTLFTKKKGSNLIILQIYVDDIIFGSTCQDMSDDFTKIMHDEFEMSMMGERNFFFGFKIKQMEDDIFFNQSKYIKEMLKKFGLEDSKPMKTLMSSDTKLTKDEEYESVDSTWYRVMIGSLLYLTASRPDIMFSVCLCTRFQEDPKTSHIEAVKRIFRYTKGTTHLGLWHPKGTGIETVVYANSDHAGDYDNVQKGHISIERVSSEDNITDILTKPLKRESFNYLRLGLGMMEHIPKIVLFFSSSLVSSPCSIPCRDNDITSFEWSLDYLEISVPSKGLYQTTPPSPNGIKALIQIGRKGHITRIRHKKIIDVEEN
ncbi:retrovirus-related pol polyprotein from transposon TNT 1-94 [Tanacetum coccineum]